MSSYRSAGAGGGDLAPVQVAPFAVKDCVLVAVATGREAQSLRELRDHLQSVDADSIYNHFWGARLRPRYDDVEYNNDLAAWAHRGLHDEVLAERLGVIDPAAFDIEELRQELLEIVEERLAERECVPWSQPDRRFQFIRSQIVVFDTGRRIEKPPELVEELPRFSLGSVFYHLIDARRRHEDAGDDLRAWLAGFGATYAGLSERLARVDPYFLTLSELREQLVSLFADYFKGRRS